MKWRKLRSAHCSKYIFVITVKFYVVSKFISLNPSGATEENRVINGKKKNWRK